MEGRSFPGPTAERRSFCSRAVRSVTKSSSSSFSSLTYDQVQAIFRPPEAIRGGIPLCFPQFGNCGSLERHGFARNRRWVVERDPPPLRGGEPKNRASVDLLLRPSEEDLKWWPHWFEFRLRVSLRDNGDLSMVSRIRNVDGKKFTFSFAYHTYLPVSDISEVRIEGLETLHYLDNLRNRERFTEQEDAVTFESEVDRVYLESPDVLAVLDHGKKKTFIIKKEGLPDTVVWNPWEKKSKLIPDFGDEEYKQMVCVDGAAVDQPITLRPGEEWTGRLELSSVPSSLSVVHQPKNNGSSRTIRS
ncbi:galactose mutarotase-like superfamily protein isoform X2 [Wolffia australiana]